MNNWIKFDAKNPETWVRDKQILVRADNGEEWLGQFAQARGVFFLKGCRGDVLLPEHITHYMTPTDPTNPSDRVSVPRELSEEDEKGIRSTPLGGCYDEQEVQEMHEAFVEYFGGKSPQAK